jgi:hypothetical protein
LITRIDILQKIIDKRKYKTYLEIGACDGTTFLALKDLDSKIAVDIEFKFPLSVFRYSKLRDGERYFEKSSDEFFSQFNEQVDLIFIDGEHSYYQVVKDVENSLKLLKNDGLIVLHDCNPPHKAAAIVAGSLKEAAEKAEFGWTGEWCGDVWKIARLFSRMIVLDCDYGLGLLKSEARCELCSSTWTEKMTYDLIDKLTYNDLEKNRVEMLKLKPPEYIDTFLE